MKRHRVGFTLGLVALAILVGTLAASAGRAASDDAGGAKADAAKIERGRYLVTFGACNDCHTPWKVGENGPEPDMSRMLSGHPQGESVTTAPALGDGPWFASLSHTFTAWSGPWGISFTKNLTPDNDTGLGTWTEQEFVQTLRTGHERGIGRELLPPMPWQWYSKASDEDLSAVWAYLRSIPPISNRVPDPIPPAEPKAQP